MSDRAPPWLAESLSRMWCPACHGDLDIEATCLRCTSCSTAYPFAGQIPQLFAAHEQLGTTGDVTDRMKAFYEENPFPNYDDFDSVASLASKARKGRFAQLLDDQVPPGMRVIECGCGTGQLTNFLSIANRRVFGVDMCMNSLGLAQGFKERNNLTDAHFIQMNLFRPIFRPHTFDLVISNGVLHHTSDPKGAFESIASMVKPGGYILIGLYHRYGRLITDLRRTCFNLTGNRFKWLDPNLRRVDTDDPKRTAWFMDQYKNPHESKHTIGEVIGWLQDIGYSFVKSIPHSKPFSPLRENENLFSAEEPGNWVERLAAELGMILEGSREGGFFVVIGRRPTGN